MIFAIKKGTLLSRSVILDIVIGHEPIHFQVVTFRLAEFYLGAEKTEPSSRIEKTREFERMQ